ncbi:hypothetical protein LJB77_02785 [Ruminococcaceae bacterium OttesenSCG-928-N02]|nr:hypothetical protein [Ruminococcaceae bacterium OttesenSCG-928-N02]
MPVDYFVNLTNGQKAAQMAFIDKHIEDERKEQKAMKGRSGGRPRR